MAHEEPQRTNKRIHLMVTAVDDVPLRSAEFGPAAFCDKRVVLGADRFASSPLICKIANFSSDGALTFKICPDGEVVHALQIASRTNIQTPHELCEWLAAWDFLVIDPPLECLYTAVQKSLSALSACGTPMRNRYKEVGNRGFLDIVLGELPGTQCEDAPQGELKNELARHDGYDLHATVEFCGKAADDEIEHEEPWARNACDVVKSCVNIISSLTTQTSSALTIAVSEIVEKALCACATSVEGAKQCIKHAKSMPKIVINVAIRTLYSAECRGRPDAILDIETVASFRDSAPQNIMECGSWLPVHPGHVNLILPTNKILPKRTIPKTIGELRDSLLHRAPWVVNVLECGKLWLTGSLLTEILDGREARCTASDVDLFCSAENLNHFRSVISSAMISYGDKLSVVQMSETRVRFTLERVSFTLKGLRAECASACDLYVNSIERVRNYHLPVVRAAFDGTHAYVYPSCATALATRINVDYEYVHGVKSPFDIVLKRWLDGFTMCVSHRELNQMIIYAKAKLNKNEVRKIIPSIGTQVHTDFVIIA